ncbi:hypothetical protein ACWDLG_26010 [Nonomuraea sp. NPDC003727]
MLFATAFKDRDPVAGQRHELRPAAFVGPGGGGMFRTAGRGGYGHLGLDLGRAWQDMQSSCH